MNCMLKKKLIIVKKNELKKKSEDTNLGVVQRNKAKNELAQHLSEDPLPLR